MQFHLNGFRPGDPGAVEASPLAAPEPRPDRLPEQVDVLIVGCGPAGLTLASQLAAFPQISTCIVDQKSGPLMLGQADGIACRTIEMFEAFGFSERVLREAYWVNETCFWKPDDERRDIIVRSGRIRDTEAGLSEFPHVILNQARIHDFYLDTMRNAPSKLQPDYGRTLLSLAVSDGAVDAGGGPQAHPVPQTHPVTARLQRAGDADVETVRARFVVGCDGARSVVRRELGRPLRGDSANQAWGVMDVLAVTDFPDIRLKAAIHSAAEGSILVIPREGGYLVRLYIELEKLDAAQRIAERNITVEQLIAVAQRILRPYTLDVKEVAWWSVYEIGQRLCSGFDDVPDEDGGQRVPCVFIAGDAGHTHSPKAGQGMNVSMQDAFNLGWKLAAVLRKQSSPEILRTYSAERQAVAQELIDFDREFAKMFSAAPRRSEDSEATGVDPAEFQRYFLKQGRFTAGTATCYGPSLISARPVHQELARGLVVGMRLHSAPVIRLADAKPVHLGHVVRADGRWRVFIFSDTGAPSDPNSRLALLCSYLGDDPASPVRRYTPAGADIDALIDVRAVLQQPHRDVAFGDLPGLLRPCKGKYGLVDYEKVFCPDPDHGDVFEARGIDRWQGCAVIVRPDQYVAHVATLDDYAGLSRFFDAFMLQP